jgi:hypothetical protein
MKLENFAHIAEVVSGIAVVISLVFLIYGIRENTEVTRAAAYGEILDNINNLALTIAPDDELSGIWQSYTEGGNSNELNDDEAFRLTLLLRTLWRLYETAYYANQYTTLGPAEWERFESGICTHWRISTPAQWNSIIVFLTEEFSSYVDSGC